MYLIYTIVIRFLYFLGFLLSPFYWKAKRFNDARKGWEESLQNNLHSGCSKIWLICPSIGEYQECRKFIERISEEKQNHQLIFTFLSPSGYEQAILPKSNSLRIILPCDTKKNARIFLDLVKPEIMFVLASGIYPNYMLEMQKRSIPHYLISFHSRESSSFYYPISRSFYKKFFSSFEYIFCYNEEGEHLLKKHFNYTKAIPIGNLRFDSVLNMKKKLRDVDGIKEFVNGKFCFVAGSTEKEEDLILAKTINNLKHLDIKWIIVPHEKLTKSLNRLEYLIDEDVSFYSRNFDIQKRILIYDITGDLFQLYNYSDVCMVGRGFHRLEIHNMLEPAVFLKPVLIGPKHKKFDEPKLFIKKNLAFEFNNEIELQNIISELYFGNIKIDKNEIKNIFDKYSGGTEKIISKLA